MLSPTLERELHQQMEQLPLDQQKQVLDFARFLAAGPVGVPGKTLLPIAGTIEASDLAIMTQAIEEDCEKVYPQDW